MISQIYDPEDPNIDTDVQFAVTKATTGAYVRHDEPNTDQPDIAAPWYSLDHQFVMESGETMLPRPPIK